jgi:hypothetical protein
VNRERFAEVDLCVSRIVAQWHEHLAQPLAALVHVAPHDRDPAAVPVLIAEPLEDARSLVKVIHKETQGNPFFVEELLRFLDEEGRLFGSDGRFNSQLKVRATATPRR